jgi:hypothetical protein
MAGLNCRVGGETCSLHRASVNTDISGSGMHVTPRSYVIQRLGDPNLIAECLTSLLLRYRTTGDLLYHDVTNFYLQARFKIEVN